MFDDSRKRRNLRMLAKIAAALAHGGDDRGEVVVGEDHVGRLLRHVGAGDAHGDADVGRLQRRARRSRRRRSWRRCCRRPAGRRRCAACARARPGRRPRPRAPPPAAPRRRGASSSAPVSARAPGSTMPRSPAMRAAVRGWSPVIMMTRTPAAARLGDGRARLRARRVDDADHAEVDELALDRLVLAAAGSPSGSGR